MAVIRLGVIGYGSRIHGLIAGPFRLVEPDLRVVAVIDPDEPGVRRRLAESDRADAVLYGSVDEMVRNARLDALAIGTRCNLHSAFACQVARHDLPLFPEKPVAITMEQATALERAFDGSRCQVVVSFPLRVSPLCVLARRYLEEGAVGQALHVDAVNYVPYGTIYWEAPYRDYEVTGGLFLQKATHDFDYLMYLMDQPIVRVAASATRGRAFGGDKPAGLVCSPNRRRVRHHAPFSATERAGSGASHFGGDLELAHDFIGLVRGDAGSRTPIQTGIQSVYACLAARASADGAGFVAVRQVGQC